MDDTGAPQSVSGHTVGGAIRSARRARDWSQAELAKKVGVRLAAVSDWERGKHTPSPANLADLARVFEVSESELRYGIVADVPAGPDTTKPVAPEEADGLEVGGERELWERIGYYRGKQELALENSETSSRLAREASEMLDRAIRALREVHEHTVPMPRGIARAITPELRRTLEGDQRALQGLAEFEKGARGQGDAAPQGESAQGRRRKKG